METNTAWVSMRGSPTERNAGLDLIIKKHTLKSNASSIMELGVAYLWLGLYQSAWKHFRDASLNFHIKGDAFYGMAGVAKWCLGKPSEAVSEWRAGLKAKYARAAGLGVRMPLLLYFASIIVPGSCSRDEALQHLRYIVEDPRVATWPGPVAQWVLGLLTEQELGKSCRGYNASDSSDRLWLASFYKNLVAHGASRESTFRLKMWELSDTSAPEWENMEAFMDRLWCEEFFLARHEVKG
jgi:hypothetical protein